MFLFCGQNQSLGCFVDLRDDRALEIDDMILACDVGERTMSPAVSMHVIVLPTKHIIFHVIPTFAGALMRVLAHKGEIRLQIIAGGEDRKIGRLAPAAKRAMGQSCRCISVEADSDVRETIEVHQNER